jgi:hypothetical protein
MIVLTGMNSRSLVDCLYVKILQLSLRYRIYNFLDCFTNINHSKLKIDFPEAILIAFNRNAIRLVDRGLVREKWTLSRIESILISIQSFSNINHLKLKINFLDSILIAFNRNVVRFVVSGVVPEI